MDYLDTIKFKHHHQNTVSPKHHSGTIIKKIASKDIPLDAQGLPIKIQDHEYLSS